VNSTILKQFVLIGHADLGNKSNNQTNPNEAADVKCVTANTMELGLATTQKLSNSSLSNAI
jgi:hypothetical protein